MTTRTLPSSPSSQRSPLPNGARGPAPWPGIAASLARPTRWTCKAGLLTVLAPAGRAGCLIALRLLSTAPAGDLLAGP